MRTTTLALMLFAASAFAVDLQVQPVASGFSAPTTLVSARDGSGFLYVAEHSGTVRVLDPKTGDIQPFLDIRDRVFVRIDFCCNEQGLLGLTFPPGDGPKDHFFVYYVDRQSFATLSRFSIQRDSNVADPASETVIQKIYHPDVNHFGGTIAFSPANGLLYWSIGDGSSGDSVVHSQDPTDPLGKVLRLNPYEEKPKYEIFALGFRNPYRFGFDSLTGDLFIGDVGENTFEELNYVPAGAPAGAYNFGWGIMEGNDCYEFQPCVTAGLQLPIYVYPHEPDGCSITAGVMYRGTQLPDYVGKFFHADFCFGHIRETHWENNGWVTNTLFRAAGLNISSFGLDEDGEMVLVSYVSGTVYRLTAATDPAPED